MNILSRQEMYSMDKYTIENLGIPGKELMENAGRGCGEIINNEILSKKSKVVIFCGTGNNGGDGFVIARYLINWQHRVKIYLLGSPSNMSPETLENYQKCQNLDITIKQIDNAEDIEELSSFSLIIDAIFGVGLKGTVKGWRAEIIKKIDQYNIPKVAIDIASGVDAQNGAAEIAIGVDQTLTMAALKYGHFLGKGREKTGKTKVIDIGIPKIVFQKFPPKSQLSTKLNVTYPQRSPFSHKGDFGKIGIIAGSPGFSGAAIMASRAALRSGAGLITLFHPKGMENIFENQLLEVMTFAYAKSEFTSADPKKMKKKLPKFFAKLNKLDAILIGPGIGVNAQAKNLLEIILKIWEKPLVIDADGLNLLSRSKNMLGLVNSQVLLTPHIGEFARLQQKNIDRIEADPISNLGEFIEKFDCNVLLKSATTLFSDGEKIVFDISGNNGLATGGSGDVLAGIIISFIGQKLSVQTAAVSASYLLGKTAEKLTKIRKTASIIPSDIIENIFKY